MEDNKYYLFKIHDELTDKKLLGTITTEEEKQLEKIRNDIECYNGDIVLINIYENRIEKIKELLEKIKILKGEMKMKKDLKESINKHIQLIKNLSSLSNIQLIAFVNILSIDNPEMFDTLKEVTEWEGTVLSEFIEENEKANEKKKKEPKKKPTKELKRVSEDMFEKSEYDRVQIGGEKQ